MSHQNDAKIDWEEWSRPKSLFGYLLERRFGFPSFFRLLFKREEGQKEKISLTVFRVFDEVDAEELVHYLQDFELKSEVEIVLRRFKLLLREFLYLSWRGEWDEVEEKLKALYGDDVEVRFLELDSLLWHLKEKQYLPSSTVDGGITVHFFPTKSEDPVGFYAYVLASSWLFQFMECLLTGREMGFYLPRPAPLSKAEREFVRTEFWKVVGEGFLEALERFQKEYERVLVLCRRLKRESQERVDAISLRRLEAIFKTPWAPVAKLASLFIEMKGCVHERGKCLEISAERLAKYLSVDPRSIKRWRWPKDARIQRGGRQNFAAVIKVLSGSPNVYLLEEETVRKWQI